VINARFVIFPVYRTSIVASFHDPTKWVNTAPKLPAEPEAEPEGTEDSPLSSRPFRLPDRVARLQPRTLHVGRAVGNSTAVFQRA
jgi:hypothetical protein